MRAPLVLSFCFALAACGKVPVQGTTDGGTDTETSTGTGTGTESSTTATPTTSGGMGCLPGASVGCTCPSGDAGAQVCNPDGKGFGPCTCEGGGSMSASDASTGATTTGVGTTAPETTTDGGTTDGSTTDGGTTSTTGTTADTGSSTGTSTTTGGVLCDDPGPEPNEAEDADIDLGNQNCGAQPQTLEGVLDGDGDVDWFSYHGSWQQICVFGPNTRHALTASDDVRLCVFADCDMGDPNFDCKDGATMAQSPNGLPGCCNGGDVNYDLDCGFLGDSARLYIRVDQAPPDACVDYSVEYDFDD